MGRECHGSENYQEPKEKSMIETIKIEKLTDALIKELMQNDSSLCLFALPAEPDQQCTLVFEHRSKNEVSDEELMVNFWINLCRVLKEKMGVKFEYMLSEFMKERISELQKILIRKDLN